MSRFVSTDTVRIDLGGGDWVVLRKDLGYGDRVSIQERLMSNLTAEQMMELDRLAEEAKAKEQGIDNGPKAPSKAEEVLKDIRLNHREANIETLLRAIVEWGGPGFTVDGQIVPISADMISLMDGTAETILLKLKEIVETKTPGFTKPPSPPTSMASSEAGQQADVSTT